MTKLYFIKPTEEQMWSHNVIYNDGQMEAVMASLPLSVWFKGTVSHMGNMLIRFLEKIDTILVGAMGLSKELIVLLIYPTETTTCLFYTLFL